MIVFFKIVKVFILSVAFLPCNAQVFDMVIDKAGRGDYATLQAAIDAVPANNAKRTLIFIRNGVYNEKVVVASTKINVSLIGESPDSVILSYDDHSGKNGLSTANSYTLWADGRDFYAENITVQNTAGSVAQAVALRSTGDKGVYKNCRFIGFQDTYYAHKNRQYMNGCFIEGATDFIFGDATAVFENCVINCVKGGQYITAPADTKLTSTVSGKKFFHGLLFKNCDVTANTDVPANSYSLGRPWQPNASSVFVKCKLGKHIRSTGWSTWSGNNHLSGFYGEFENTDFEGNPIDVSQRVSWSKQIDSVDYHKYYNLNYFFRKDWVVWDAANMVKTLRSPSDVTVNESIVTWNVVDDAIGYALFNADTLVGFSLGNSFELSNALQGEITVKSVRETGALSTSGNENVLSVQNLLLREKDTPLLQLKYKEVLSDREVCFEVFDIKGQKLVKSMSSMSINLKTLPKGMFIVKATDLRGGFSTLKIRL